MKIFPAIDVYDNRAVRLLYGKRDMITDYGSPLERSEKWVESGAEYLHLVDLNGAFDDSLVNNATLKEVIKNIKIPVQIGGGIKTFDRIKYYIEEIGVARVIIGSACVTAKDMVEKACEKYKDKIVCGIDALDGFVCIKGWVEKSKLTPIELAMNMKNLGINIVVYTDISRDGALSGVNVLDTVELQNQTGMYVIASGGMSTLSEVRLLKDKSVYGAILGRSIYTGDIDLAEAIKLGR